MKSLAKGSLWRAWFLWGLWALMMGTSTAAKAEPALEWGVCPATHEQQVLGDYKTPWCYQKCSDDAYGAGPLCIKKSCPPGTTNTGLTCTGVATASPQTSCPEGTTLAGFPAQCYEACPAGMSSFQGVQVAGIGIPNPVSRLGCNAACPPGTWVADMFSCWKPEVQFRVELRCKWIIFCWPVNVSFNVNVRTDRQWAWAGTRLATASCPAGFSPVVPNFPHMGCQKTEVTLRVWNRPDVVGQPAQVCPSGYAKNPVYPIVLVHGLLGFNTLKLPGGLPIEYFNGFKKALEGTGAIVEVVQVPAMHSTEVRGEELAKKVREVLRKYPGKDRVHLIGHSHGGPTIRYLGGKYPEMVASLTTIAGANYGTQLADYFLAINNLPVGTQVLDQVQLALLGLVGLFSDDDFRNMPQSQEQAFASLSVGGAEKFNQAFPWGLPGMGGSLPTPLGYVQKDGRSHPQLWYSWTGAQPFSNAGPLSGILASIDGLIFQGIHGLPSDGLLPVKHASFGHSLGVYEQDHAGEINLLGSFSLLWGKAHPVTLFCEHANRLKRHEQQYLGLDAQGRAPALTTVATHANGVPLGAPKPAGAWLSAALSASEPMPSKPLLSAQAAPGGHVERLYPAPKTWQWQCHRDVTRGGAHFPFRLDERSRAQCLSTDGKSCATSRELEACQAMVASHAVSPMKIVTEVPTMGAQFAQLAASSPGSTSANRPAVPAWAESVRARLHDWSCQEGINTPVRRNEAGDAQCLSSDGRSCQWGNSREVCLSNVDAAKKAVNLRPLTCGDALKATEGTRGYDQPGHWCEVAQRTLAR